MIRRLQASAVLCLAILVPAAPGAQLPADFGPRMLDDVRRIAATDSNPARREVLETILSEREVAFTAEAFSIEPGEDEARTEGVNLVVTIGEGDADIVIGAHYDTVRLPDGSFGAGAVDNAAGSVILTRLAQALEGGGFRHRIRIVFFDMEELGLIGSERYVEAHGARTVANINLDVNAYGDTLIFGPARNPGNESVYRALREVCVSQGSDCEAFPAYPPSDDRSFQAAGIPNVSIGIVAAAEARQLWLLLNSDTAEVFVEGFLPRTLGVIHTSRDRPELIEPAAMERVYRTVLALVDRLDSPNE